MVNVGSWVYERLFISGGPGRNPYWPGNVGVVDDNGPPRLHGLLGDRSQDDLRQPTRA